jgi:hypothetical protein
MSEAGSGGNGEDKLYGGANGGYVQGVVLTWTAGSLSSRGSGYNVRYSVGWGKETVGKVGT